MVLQAQQRVGFRAYQDVEVRRRAGNRTEESCQTRLLPGTDRGCDCRANGYLGNGIHTIRLAYCGAIA